MYKHVIYDNSNIKGEKCTGTQCLYIIKIKFLLLRLGCNKFKMLILIPKVITKKITKNYTE